MHVLRPRTRRHGAGGTCAFATESQGAPQPGLSLYRFSAGHGGLQCAACHGSTHAEYPSSHGNDNLQSLALQGHVGTLGECTACHAAGVPSVAGGGPHGMHPVGQAWVAGHHDAIGSVGLAQCATCHGGDYRGTELSRMFGARTLSIEHVGTRSFFRGQQVGCYTCHRGPNDDNANHAPVAANGQLATATGVAVGIRLSATDADGDSLIYRIVSPHGTVGLSNGQATYFPFDGYAGPDLFTWAAWDGSTDSNLATVTVSVSSAPCTLTLTASVPGGAAVGAAVAFTSSATALDCQAAPTYAWTFGDGGTASTPNASHVYAAAGSYTWTVVASIGGVSAQRSGTIAITVSAPTVTRVTALQNPWRLQIDGTNFQPGVKVYIGSDTSPWEHGAARQRRAPDPRRRCAPQPLPQARDGANPNRESRRGCRDDFLPAVAEAVGMGATLAAERRQRRTTPIPTLDTRVGGWKKKLRVVTAFRWAFT